MKATPFHMLFKESILPEETLLNILPRSLERVVDQPSLHQLNYKSLEILKKNTVMLLWTTIKRFKSMRILPPKKYNMSFLMAK